MIDKSYNNNDRFVNLVIQLNGKKKVIHTIKKGLSKEKTAKIAIKCLQDKNIYKNEKQKKIIVIPDRIVNIVTE